MKKFTFLLVLIFCHHQSFSQFTWNWLDGTAITPGAASFGIRGRADSVNYPGTRIGQTTWIDKSGDTWVFGGLGYNDIWKFSEASGNWTWINGTKSPVDKPVYGVPKVFSPTNRIGARNYASSWIDAAGDLWVFGGQRDPTCWSSMQVVEATNQLWKYSTAGNQWAWMGGDTTAPNNFMANRAGRYGIKGIESPLNKPPTKHHAMNWIDKEGNLWLFGGSFGGVAYGTNLNGPSMLGNDLWKYSPATGFWTWLKGDSLNLSYNAPNVFSSYGTKGVESASNTPGQRYAGTTWTDSSGNFWLFGGFGFARWDILPPTSNLSYYGGALSDLWKFSPVSGRWTWMGGDTIANMKGSYFSSQPWPGARFEGTAWNDVEGNLWLRSGSQRQYSSDYNGVRQMYNDVWRYSIAENRWTWVSGDTALIAYEPIDVKKHDFRPGLHPGADPAVVSQRTSGKLLFSVGGGQRWLYDTAAAQWAFVKGDMVPTNPADPLIDTTGKPPARYYATTWKDSENNLYLFGGQQSQRSYADLFDLWKYSLRDKKWTFLKGGKGFSSFNVGKIGQPSDDAQPSARCGAYTYTDAQGKLWMFAGINNSGRNLSDLWSYNPVTNQWTLHNSGNTYSIPIYTATASEPAWPGPRGLGNAWLDASNNFWISGGQVGTYGNVTNEIWRLDTKTLIWTFISGDKMTKYPPYDPGVTGRTGATSWIDRNGDFWTFGGGGYNDRNGDFGEMRFKYTNDLKKYSPATKYWTTVKGSALLNSRGKYGTKGVASADNMPRARMYASGWTDADGNLYLFGGSKDTVRPCSYTSTEFLNDLWKFNVATNQWTWIGGEEAGNTPGWYGIQGTPSPLNEPGARMSAATWSDGSGKAWIYGGYGYAQSGKRSLDDVMMFSASAEAALPVTYNRFTATANNGVVNLEWITASEQHSRAFVVQRSADGLNFSTIGTVPAAGTSSSPTRYTFPDYHPLSPVNHYRLKQVDLDERFEYSPVVKLELSRQQTGLVLLTNPVQENLKAGLELPAAASMIIRVADLNGRILITREQAGLRGNNQITVPVGKLSKGSYILSVQTNSVSERKTFIRL